MHSIRTKITLLTVCAIFIVMLIATISGIVAIRNIGTASADQTLLLLCETGQKNLNHYFDSAEMAVDGVYAFAEKDLAQNGIEAEQFGAHIDRVSDVFKRLTVTLSFLHSCNKGMSRNFNCSLSMALKPATANRH